MTAVAEPLTLGAGVHPDIPEEAYHADPVAGGSLSSSGAKKLLPPSCPALFRYEQDHGQPPKKAFDFGSAAHREVLGAGADIVVVDAADWRTKAAKEEAAAARLAGKTPLLAHEYRQVQDMAKAIRDHPIASALLTPEGGKPEQTLVWEDAETGVMLRARLDWMPNQTGRRMVIGDYKSAVSANPEAFRKSAHDYGYHSQNAWYLDGIRALGLDDDPDFVFVVQMKTPPYLVSLVRLDEEALRVGAERNAKARRIFADCQESGYWPGFTDLEIAEVSLPSYAIYQHDNQINDN